MSRAEWVAQRAASANQSQMHFARRGVVTPEMELVAKSEQIESECVRSEIARGRMVLPANIRHLTLQPMCIGIAARCKVNANIGSSQVASDVGGELEKLCYAIRYGADTVMDLSTGGDIDGIRCAIIAASPVPVGTVPIYQALELAKDTQRLTADDLLDMLEHQAKQGVDYFTIHAGLLREHLPLVKGRHHGHRLARRINHRAMDDRA